MNSIFPKERISARVLAAMALMIAANIVLSRLLKFDAGPFVRVSFEIIPLVFISAFFGWYLGGIAAGVSDIVGALLFPVGLINPGITVSRIVTGIIFGVFLYKKTVNVKTITIAYIVNALIVELGLMSLSLSLPVFMQPGMPAKTFFAVLSGRLLKLLLLPVYIVITYLLWKKAGERVFNQYKQ